MGFQKMCGCVWEKKGLTCYQSDAKVRAGSYINAGRTLQHKPLSTTEGQRVTLMNLGSLTEIRDDSINSGHRRPEKRKLSTWIGTSTKQLPMRFDDGLCECRHYGQKARGPPSSGIV